MKYKVKIEVIQSTIETIEANSKEEAEELAWDMIDNEELFFEPDYPDYKVTVVENVKKSYTNKKSINELTELNKDYNYGSGPNQYASSELYSLQITNKEFDKICDYCNNWEGNADVGFMFDGTDYGWEDDMWISNIFMDLDYNLLDISEAINLYGFKNVKNFCKQVLDYIDY